MFEELAGRSAANIRSARRRSPSSSKRTCSSNARRSSRSGTTSPVKPSGRRPRLRPPSARPSGCRRATAKRGLSVEVGAQLAPSAEPGDEVAVTLLDAAKTLIATDPETAAVFGRRALEIAPPHDPRRGEIVSTRRSPSISPATATRRSRSRIVPSARRSHPPRKRRYASASPGCSRSLPRSGSPPAASPSACPSSRPSCAPATSPACTTTS